MADVKGYLPYLVGGLIIVGGVESRLCGGFPHHHRKSGLPGATNRCVKNGKGKVETIRPAIAIVKDICGAQKAKQGIPYRLSRHSVRVPCEEGTLLYHTLTGALMLLPADQTMREERVALKQNWFLVPKGFDDRKFADDVMNIARMTWRQAPEKTDFTILTTTDCNARCFYCYEMGVRRLSMTAETAREAAACIVRRCAGKPVRLRWFGGEPLYNREAIDIICTILREEGIPYESGMVSNGFYFDRETAQTADQYWRLKKIQITIDGTEAVYNRTKAYIDNDENPYRRVMNNIKTALETGIAVTIRLNMYAWNAEDLLFLMDEIGNRFPGPVKPEIYIALLHEFAGKIHRYRSRQDTEQAYYTLRNTAEEMGMLRQRTLPDTLRINRCMADSDACETILPDGRVGRCEHFSDAMITGNIWEDRRDTDVEKKWKAPLRVAKCQTCLLYPQCTKLEMCEWNRNGCDEMDRRIRTEELKRQILATFHEFRNGGECD